MSVVITSLASSAVVGGVISSGLFMDIGVLLSVSIDIFITVFIVFFFANILIISPYYNIYNKKINVMAKAQSKSSNVSVRIEKPKKKRPGVHSKSKSSKLKKSKNYLKKYRGQGAS
jgi:hypothetical protein